MNSSAGEEILSAAEVSETNQVTVATVTITSTTNTQTVAGTRACYILYLPVMLHSKPYCYIGINPNTSKTQRNSF